MKAHVKKGTHVPTPVTIPRVWRDTEHDGPKDQSTPEEIGAFFGSRLRIRYHPEETEA